MNEIYFKHDGKNMIIKFESDAEKEGALKTLRAMGYSIVHTTHLPMSRTDRFYLATKQEKGEWERWEIAKIIAKNFSPCGNSFDDSDFEWAALQLQEAGYHKVEGSKE